MYVCIFIKLHITAQSGPVIRVILLYVYLYACYVYLYWYVRMVITYSKSIDQLGQVVYPSCGQLNTGAKMNISLSPFAPENLVSRDGFNRLVPRQSAHSTYSRVKWCLLTGFLWMIYSFKPQYAIGSVKSLSGHATAYRWYSLPKVSRRRASSPQGSSSNGCCLCITMDQLMCASLFPHPLYYYWYVLIAGMLKLSEAKYKSISKVK